MEQMGYRAIVGVATLAALAAGCGGDSGDGPRLSECPEFSSPREVPDGLRCT